MKKKIISELYRKTSAAADGLSDATAAQHESVSLGTAPVTAPVQQRTFLGETAVYRTDKLLWCSALKKV